MTTMSCRQLGGPCDHSHLGETADEIIKAQDRHLSDAVAQGDTSHVPALQAMKGRWKHPIAGMRWYKDVKQTFGQLADN